MSKLTRKKVWGWVIAVTGSCVGAAEASAATLIVTSNTVAVTDRREYTPLTFSAFDGSLGSLTSIFVQYYTTYSALSNVTYSQSGNSNITYTAGYHIEGILGQPFDDIYLTNSASQSKSGRPCGFNCVANGGTQVLPPVTLTVSGAGTVSKSQLITDPNVLSNFVGNDPLSLDNITSAFAENGTATASTYLTVRYVYDQAAAPSGSAVPEPASWAMMILGLGAVGYAMRRRLKVTTSITFAA